MADAGNQEPEDNLDPTAEFGVTGLKKSAGYIYEEELKSLRGLRGIRTYKEMSDTDPSVGAVLFVIENYIRQVVWRVESADEDSEEANRYKEFIEQCMEDMEHTWDDFISEVLSMISYGYSYFEVVYKSRGGESDDPRRNSMYSDNLVGWRKFPIRSQDSLWRWEFDEHDRVRGFWQYALYDEYRTKAPTNKGTFQRYISTEKALHFRTRSQKNNPEGRSMLRNAVRPYYFKKRIEEFEAIGIERDLAGYPVFELPLEYLQKNASDGQKAIRAMAETLIRGIRRDQLEGAVVPAEMDCEGKPTGFKLRLLNSGGRRQHDTNTIINRYGTAIAIVMLADFITMNGNSQSGNRSLVTGKEKIFATALSAVLESIVQTLNRQAIIPLMRLNGFDTSLAPKFAVSDISTPPLQEVAQYVLSLANAGLPMSDQPTQQALRDLAKLPDPPEDEEELL